MEYAIAKKVEDFAAKEGIKFFYTAKAIADNKRDSQHYSKVPKDMQNDFKACGTAFLLWADKKRWFTDASSISVDRLSDSAGVEGVVTDIRFSINYKDGSVSTHDISLKHNHNALKHPRLPSLPAQCDIDDADLKEKYLGEWKSIWEQFIAKARNITPNATEFSQLKIIDESIVERELYKPLIKMATRFLQENANRPHQATTFFRFLTSKVNFYVVKNEPTRIVIRHFVNIKPPSSFCIEYPYKGKMTTCIIKFDNGWKVTMRLHNASKEFFRNGKINRSVKFDVVCINIDSVIETESMPKTLSVQ